MATQCLEFGSVVLIGSRLRERSFHRLDANSCDAHVQKDLRENSLESLVTISKRFTSGKLFSPDQLQFSFSPSPFLFDRTEKIDLFDRLSGGEFCRSKTIHHQHHVVAGRQKSVSRLGVHRRWNRLSLGLRRLLHSSPYVEIVRFLLSNVRSVLSVSFVIDENEFDKINDVKRNEVDDEQHTHHYHLIIGRESNRTFSFLLGKIAWPCDSIGDLLSLFSGLRDTCCFLFSDRFVFFGRMSSNEFHLK